MYLYAWEDTGLICYVLYSMAEPAIEVRSDVDRPVPPGWQRMHCAEGTYYWHSATDTSQWEYPS